MSARKSATGVALGQTVTSNGFERNRLRGTGHLAAGHIGCMKLPSRPGAWPVHIHPGFLVIASAMSVACWLMLAAVRFKVTGVAHTHWWEGLLAGLLALAAVAVHEGAHAVVGARTGRRVERIEFGLKIGVVTAGDSTALRRAASIAAGPLAEVAVGLILWAGAGGGGAALLTPVGMAGAMAVVNGACNLLPLCPAMDGFKLLRFLLLAARGHSKLKCAPVGVPCPACAGVTPQGPETGKPRRAGQGSKVVLPVVTRG